MSPSTFPPSNSTSSSFTIFITSYFFFFTTKGTNIFTDTVFPKEKCYIIFGREDAGIPEEILKEHPDTSLRIPMIDEARSLNLSNSAAIVAYEVLRQWGYPGLLTEGQLTKFEW